MLNDEYGAIILCQNICGRGDCHPFPTMPPIYDLRKVKSQYYLDHHAKRRGLVKASDFLFADL